MTELSDIMDRLDAIKTKKAIEEDHLKKLKKEATKMNVKNFDELDENISKLASTIEKMEKTLDEFIKKAQEYLEEHEIQ